MEGGYLMEYEILPIFHGFPAKSERGFLGWSSAYLIKVTSQHSQKYFLFDTGGYNERLRLQEILQENNLTYNDIDGVIISHLHFDHAVNWMLFPKAKIYIHRLELHPTYEYIDFAIPDFHKEKLLQQSNLHFIKENDEIEGMRVVELPGHTEGLIGLQVGDKFLVSDAVKNRTEINGGELMNTWNVEVARKSIEKINREATCIYPGHDVPLIKENNKWSPLSEPKQVITFASGLTNQFNQNNTEIIVKNSY